MALATVVGVRRSAPRPPGAKITINDKGEVSAKGAIHSKDDGAGDKKAVAAGDEG